MSADKITRRVFVSKSARGIAVGAGIQALSGRLKELLPGAFAQGLDKPASDGADQTLPEHSYKLSPWTGDNFTRGHELRDGRLPKLAVEAQRSVDFVIVGGGMSGLSSAYYLRDHDFLLLEQYDELGGHARGGSSRGIGYSYGSAYIGDSEKNEDDLHTIIAELGLKPVPMYASKNAWRWENEWIPGISGAGKDVYRDFKRIGDSAEPVLRELEKSTPLLPLTNEGLARLDRTPFASCLSGYDRKFIALIDAYCRSSYCLGVERCSALAGYSAIGDLLEPIHVFEGGNPTLSRAIAERAGARKPERFVKGAFVWAVEVKEHGASVVYSTADGTIHKVNARFVIVCTPPMIAARILSGIQDAAKASLLSLKYGSYLVANFLLKRKGFSGAYDNWVTAPFSFCDVIEADKPYEVNGAYKPNMGSVLTIYQPYEPGSSGRASLYQGDRQAFATSLVEQMQKLVPGIESDLEEVVLTRWGHGVAVPDLGYFKKVSKFNSTSDGAFAIAHCSSQGLPCTEAAVRAARLATRRALNSKAGGSQVPLGENPLALDCIAADATRWGRRS